MREAAAQCLGCHVHELDLIDARQKRVGDRHDLSSSGDSLDDVVLRFDVTHPQCGDHVNAGCREAIDVGPTPSILTQGATDPGEIIDQHDTRPPGQHRVDIESSGLSTDMLEAVEQRGGAPSPVGLDHADHNVAAALGASTALGKHRGRGTDAGRRTEVHTYDTAIHETPSLAARESRDTTASAAAMARPVHRSRLVAGRSRARGARPPRQRSCTPRG